MVCQCLMTRCNYLGLLCRKQWGALGVRIGDFYGASEAEDKLLRGHIGVWGKGGARARPV